MQSISLVNYLCNRVHAFIVQWWQKSTYAKNLHKQSRWNNIYPNGLVTISMLCTYYIKLPSALFFIYVYQYACIKKMREDNKCWKFKLKEQSLIIWRGVRDLRGHGFSKHSWVCGWSWIFHTWLRGVHGIFVMTFQYLYNNNHKVN